MGSRAQLANISCEREIMYGLRYWLLGDRSLAAVQSVWMEMAALTTAHLNCPTAW